MKAVFRKQNGHISAASNSALSLASGDYLVLLDHDDKLHPLALYFVSKEIKSHPESVVIYSDEDKLTERGKRIEPYFKSDFDYELLLGQNMVSHLGAYKSEIIRKIGGFRIGLEGSQDYDLLLRVIEQIELHQIRHIPKVLYHWRISKQSVANTVDVKPYALEAGIQALQDHLLNQEINAEVKTYERYGYKIKYAIPHPEPHVTCFIKSEQASDRLIQNIDSLVENTNYNKLSLFITIDKGNSDPQIIDTLQKIKPSQINFLYNDF
ncbi:MAG: glycosyltransferase [Bacteroidales bacterium]